MMPAAAHAQNPDRHQCLEQAARCRRLAYSICDRQATATLLAMAEQYERDAMRLRRRARAV